MKKVYKGWVIEVSPPNMESFLAGRYFFDNPIGSFNIPDVCGAVRIAVFASRDIARKKQKETYYPSRIRGATITIETEE